MIVSRFTTTAIAVFGICRSITSLFYMLIRAVGSAIIPIVAYNLGTRDRKRMNEAIKMGIVYNVIIMTLGTVLIETATVHILHLFNASPDMLAIGVTGIRLLSSSFIVAAIKDTCGMVMQAIGKGIGSMYVTIIRHLVCLLPLAYMFSLTDNLTWVWFSVPIADIIGCVFAIWLLGKSYHAVLGKNCDRLITVGL